MLRRVLFLGLLAVALLGAPGCSASTAAPEELLQLLEAMSLEPGMVVADVGAGDGEWSEALAREVGPLGHVYSTEVDEDDLEDVNDRLERSGLDNFTTILGDQNGTGLSADCCDAVLVRLVYHHFTDPPRMISSLRSSLRDGAPLVVIEISPQEDWQPLPGVPERDGHGISMDDLIREMADGGFEVTARFDDWEGDEDHYGVVFRVATEDQQTD
jgi:cyclopropane fatty-acyl-phospholipid synthase-like methyltransferase